MVGSVWRMRKGAVVAAALAVGMVSGGAAFASPGSTDGSSAHGTLGISGGKRAEQGAYPWMVVVLPPSGNLCSGAVINHGRGGDEILTARHCVEDGKFKGVQILGGSVDQTDPTVEAGVTDGRLSGVEPNDFAVLKTDKPLGLPTLRLADTKEYDSGDVRILGWGSTGGKFPSQYLMEGDIPILDDAKCKQAAGTDYDPSVNFCAGNWDKGGVAAWPGDSGGPAVRKTKNGDWVAVGITSRASKASARRDDPQNPGIFVKVSSQYQAIQKAVSELG